MELKLDFFFKSEHSYRYGKDYNKDSHYFVSLNIHVIWNNKDFKQRLDEHEYNEKREKHV